MQKGFKYILYAKIKVLEIMLLVTLTGDMETATLTSWLTGTNGFVC